LSWRPTTLVAPNVEKSGALTYPDPLGPWVACCGSTFTFYIYQQGVHLWDHVLPLWPATKTASKEEITSTNMREWKWCSTEHLSIGSNTCLYHQQVYSFHKKHTHTHSMGLRSSICTLPWISFQKYCGSHHAALSSGRFMLNMNLCCQSVFTINSTVQKSSYCMWFSLRVPRM
jgi:hypothetical protein